MSLESSVADHYAGGDLLAAIEAGVEAAGKSPATVTVEDLGPVDEFHIGGRPATAELCQSLGVSAKSNVLDIGCGIGGTARFLASTVGCRMTGLDLTPEYVDVARALTAWTNLEDRASFEVGSALDMPFEDGTFDGAVQLHVGMNIPDKATLFSEVHRVLRPGGRIGIYDVLRVADGDIAFPVPWAANSSMSFVEDLSTYQGALEAAGFRVDHERNRGEFAKQFFATLRERAATGDGPPPLGLHLIIGKETPQRIANMVAAIEADILAPVELIGHKPG